MNEHDDDLESRVHEQAEEETDTFPDTNDELDAVDEQAEDGDEAPNLDDDEAEL
jgi:hypothetical protein